MVNTPRHFSSQGPCGQEFDWFFWGVKAFASLLPATVLRPVPPQCGGLSERENTRPEQAARSKQKSREALQQPIPTGLGRSSKGRSGFMPYALDRRRKGNLTNVYSPEHLRPLTPRQIRVHALYLRQKEGERKEKNLPPFSSR